MWGEGDRRRSGQPCGSRRNVDQGENRRGRDIEKPLDLVTGVHW